MMLMEFDLSGAEWVIVAYLSGDANMLDVVQSGKSPHIVTGHLMTGVPEEIISKENKIVDKHTDPDTIEELRREGIPEIFELATKFLPRSMSCRQAGKKSNHALDYAMRFRRFALENEIDEREAKIMVDLYNNEAYPGVPKWQEDIRRELRNNDRTLYNLLGRKVRLLDEWGDDLFNAAYSFKPQSTVGDCVNEALCILYEDQSAACQLADILTQTHDSATVQYPVKDFLKMSEFALEFEDRISPELEATDIHGVTRKFHIKVDMKIGKTWGDMHEVHLTPSAHLLAKDLEAMWKTL